MSSPADRARDWRRAALAAVCEISEPWDHGLVYRASRYPSYYDFNVVWVEGDPGLSAVELIAVADAELAGLEHRRLDFADAEAAERVRADLEAEQFETTRLSWMLHTEPLPPGETPDVEEVDYDAVLDLRLAWHNPEGGSRDHLANAREVAMTRAVQVIAARAGDQLVGFAQLERAGGGAEISEVYVRPAQRGSGRGTALTRAAIGVAGDVDDLWIVADDEDRPKQLYARLGFRPVWTSTEFVRRPGRTGDE